MRATLSLSMVWPKDLESMRSVSGAMDEVVQLVKGWWYGYVGCVIT